jgi:hypothetical protein
VSRKQPQRAKRLKQNGPTVPRESITDPAEAVERIVPRRQLLLEDGDVLIVRAPSGLSLTGRVYQLRVRGAGPLAGRFVSFEHAAAAGDQLAAGECVRLFYVDSDSEQEVPHLLKDYRPTRKPKPNR